MAAQLPLNISIAPFPEGFQGDMDQTFQQAVQLMEATVEGNFLPGQVLPPGSTLPTTDQGPILMGGTWYFWNPATGSYQPQSITAKAAKNFAKNCVYQVQQTGSTFTVGAGVTKIYDMSLCRSTLANVLAISPGTGPLAGPLNDLVPSSIKYTVGPTLVPTLGVTDLYAHEHLIEGSDIVMLQGEILTLTIWVWTNTPGTYSVYLTSSGRDCSYVANFTVATPNVWQAVTVPNIPAIPAIGTWLYGESQTGMYVGVAFGVGTQWQTATPNAWHPAFCAGTPQNTDFLTVINNQIEITGIKLEASSVGSYLSVPSFDTDLWECIRYYFTTFDYQSTTAGIPMNLSALADGIWSGSMLFPRRMAKGPSVIPFSYLTNTAGQIADISNGVDIAITSLAATPKGVCDLSNASFSTTGTTNSTINITAIPSTTRMRVGQIIAGSGIPAGATIVSIVSGTAITISSAATSGASGVALTISNQKALISTTGTLTALTFTGTLTLNSTAVTAISSTATLAVGMSVTGTGVPPSGTVIDYITSGTAILISKVAAGAGTGVTLTFGTFSITGIPSTTGMLVGQPISGSGIQAGTIITAIVSGTAITISNPAVAFGTGVALTVCQTTKGDDLWAYITADARLT